MIAESTPAFVVSASRTPNIRLSSAKYRSQIVRADHAVLHGSDGGD
jgi:hypothetical protein